MALHATVQSLQPLARGTPATRERRPKTATTHARPSGILKLPEPSFRTAPHHGTLRPIKVGFGTVDDTNPALPSKLRTLKLWEVWHIPYYGISAGLTIINRRS